MCKWLLLAGLLLCGAGGALLIVMQLSSSARYHIDREHFAKLRVGMTVDEVSAVLGFGPGNYAADVARTFSVDDCESFPADVVERLEDGFEKEWVTDKAAIRVVFTAEGKGHFFVFQKFTRRPMKWERLIPAGLRD